MRILPALIALPMLLANAEPQQMPYAVRQMLDAAMASGNDGEVTTIAKYARRAAPGSADEITTMVAGWRSHRAKLARVAIESAGPLDLWKGKVELSGYITSGNTHDAGISGAADATRETLRWRHKVRLLTDFQRSNGVVSREHYLASYEPNFKFSNRAYVYGTTQYESDHFLGYDNRYSVSVGAGYSAIKDPRTTLDVELGPAYRYTNFTDRTLESSIAARGSVDFEWKLTHAISLSENASAYLQQINSTVSSTTAISARVIGPLSAKLSYNYQYESTPPIGRVSTDTSTRAGLSYAF